jgi:hypothetical protein
MPTYSRKYIRERLKYERLFELMQQMDPDRVTYPLCAGHKCFTGNGSCDVAVPMMKDYALGWRRSNTVLCCCWIAQVANENNLRTEEQVGKYLRDIVLWDEVRKLVNEK